MKYLLIILLLIVGCAKDSKESPPPKSKLEWLTIEFNSDERIYMYEKTYYYSYFWYDGVWKSCHSEGSFKDLNAGSNRGKACFRVESTTCTPNTIGLIVSHEYSLMQTSSGLYVNVINENLWDKDCDF